MTQLIGSFINVYLVVTRLKHMSSQVVDIHSRGSWPSNELSNFTYHPFIMDNQEFASIEGFYKV